jgi:cobalt-zinc-cadmium efflux system outer membrane protein
MAAASTAWGVDLTEQEAVARALARPAYLEIDAGRLAAARGAVREAGVIPNPVVHLDHERVPLPGGRSTETSASIAQSVDLFGKRSLRVDAAQSRAASAEHEARSRRLQTVAEVRRAFADALYLERQRQVLSAWSARVAAASEIVSRLARSGDVAGYARRRIEREAHAAQARVSAVQADGLRAAERLRALAALDAGELRPRGDLAPQPPAPMAAALASVRERADLAALLAQADAFERERALAERAWAPDVTLGLGQKRIDEPGGSGNGLILSLAFPMPLFDRGEGRRDIAAGQARALRAEHALLLARIEAEVRGLWQQAAALQSGAMALRAAPASELSRIAETAYRAGESGILELLDAYRTELDAQLAAMDLEMRARLARIELDAFTGVDRGY